MSFYSIYRIVKDITRTIFGYKFWRKLLIIILVAFGLWFFLHNQGYCIEETEDINYQVYQYYDALVNDAIIRINKYIQTNGTDNVLYRAIIDNTNCFYFYYGNYDGTSYNNGRPIVNQNLYIAYRNRFTSNSATASANDYLGVTGFTMYSINWSHFYFANDNFYNSNYYNTYFPLFVTTYTSSNWTNYITALTNNDTQAIIQLLESIESETQQINENLTSTDYDDTVVNVSNDAIDNMANSTDGMFTTIFTNFNNAVSGGVSQLEIPLPHTEQKLIITSDIVSSHLGGLTYLVQAFWMYVFGLYTWRFVNNLIHRIKDGSILDGFKTDGEVITNTML